MKPSYSLGGVVDEPLLIVIEVVDPVHILIDSWPPKKKWFKSWRYLVPSFKLIWHPSRYSYAINPGA